jgi:putative aldouronate transport system permease protein
MAKKRRKLPASTSDKIFDTVNVVVMLIIVVVMLYPFLNVLAISFNTSSDTVKGGITIWPRQFTLENFKKIFTYPSLLIGFRNSVLRTVIGTILSVFCDSIVAFTLSRKEFRSRKFVSTFMALTLYLSGGLVPSYMLIRDLHLMNTFWVYIFPGMVSAFNIFVVRSFMDGLPYSLQESAKLDGANDFQIYWRVIMPLCKPVLATIALFVAVGQWNQWFDTYLYNSMSPNLTTLQYELMKILQSNSVSTNVNDQNTQQLINMVTPESLQMAITIFVTLPIIVVYPFLQRYFMKGMTLGAVKD